MSVIRKAASNCVPSLVSIYRDFSKSSQCTDKCGTEDKCTRNVSEKLLQEIGPKSYTNNNKVTIIGCGHVGMACAVSILEKNIANEICIVDINKARLISETMDLQHGSIYLNDATIRADTDYSISADSRVCIITAGMAQIAAGETRLALTNPNAEIIHEIVTKFAKTSPSSIIVMVTNPVDIMTYVAWKASAFPKNQVIGSGTILDSARLRFMLANRLKVSPTSCKATVIGEHGHSAVVVWSQANVAGVRLRDIYPCIGLEEDPLEFHKVREEVIKAARLVKDAKGYTNWAIALCVASITEAILKNFNRVMPISTHVKGLYGIDKDVFLSVPCVVNACGATAIVRQDLSDLEVQQLKESAEIVYKAQSGIGKTT